MNCVYLFIIKSLLTLCIRKQYVDLYIDWFFNKSVEKQFEAFNTGFKFVSGSPVLKIFQAHELRDVLIGNAIYDWNVFENNATYVEGYNSTDLTVSIVQS